MQRHSAIVRDISNKVRQFYDKKIPFRISHGSTNSTRQSLAQRPNVIDTSQLCNVLSIDAERKTAIVEPNVPMDRLVASTLPHGLVPPVVMEFPGITAGGGYAGTAGESSSFKHGFFDRTVNYVEIVLGNGEVVLASQQDRQDLFNGAAGAVGTLGVTTLLELQLMDAMPYVQATYHPVDGIEAALESVQELVAQPEIDYVDGIMFSKSHGAIVSGKLTTDVPAGHKLQHFSRPWDPWFYLHVEDAIRKSGKSSVTETIPLQEYLFRYDRGGFWVGRAAFKYWHFPFNRLTRWFLDDFLHTRMLYRALHASRQSNSFVVQDLALPYETAPQFVEYTDKQFGIYPLWLCPLKQNPLPTFHPQLPETESDGTTLKPMINIGLWGQGPKDAEEFILKNQELEEKLRELRGMKWFYAQTYYAEKAFWDIYKRKWYDELRAKYHATFLPTVYDKVWVDVDAQRLQKKRSWSLWFLRIWPFAGVWGIWKAMMSGDWRIPRQIQLASLKIGRPGSSKSL